MVIDKDLKPLHKLTEVGEEHYEKFLEEKADEILFKHQHPFKWFMQKVMDRFEKLKKKYFK